MVLSCDNRPFHLSDLPLFTPQSWMPSLHLHGSSLRQKANAFHHRCMKPYHYNICPVVVGLLKRYSEHKFKLNVGIFSATMRGTSICDPSLELVLTSVSRACSREKLDHIIHIQRRICLLECFV